MKKSSFPLLAALILILACKAPREAVDAPNPPPGYRLGWADEFTVPGLPDSTKWSYDAGGHGWGNNELQFYSEARPENARVENGRLLIEARRDNYMQKTYSSARLVSKGKGDWRYGYIEVKAKLPRGRGTWPAIWMLPTEWKYGNWPGSGEIDVMEHVGYDPGIVHGSVHTKRFNHLMGTQKTDKRPVQDVSDTFHSYAVEWTADTMVFLIDRTEYFRFANDGAGWETWPFDQSFHVVLNVAVGGNWGGQQGIDESIWPQRMEVEYVRVYEQVGKKEKGERKKDP